MHQYACVFFHLILFFLLHGTICQDLQIYGIFDASVSEIDSRKVGEIYGSCFRGFGLTSCVPNLPDDDLELSFEMPYYKTMESRLGGFYCLQCCGTSPDHIDVWDLSCETDFSTISSTNVYGFELRMARNRNQDDNTIITCPLKRSACTYTDTGAFIGCDRSNDNTFLIGYEATLEVDQLDLNFDYWRGVSSCSIESIESNVSLTEGDIFTERIIMKHTPQLRFDIDYSKLFILLIAVIFISYIVLHYFRRKRCEYCQGKLVFSFKLCYKCKLVGAEPPDPVLMQAMERKGELIQGKPPERFPGLRFCHRIMTFIVRLLCCRCGPPIKVNPLVGIKIPDDPVVIPDVEEQKESNNIKYKSVFAKLSVDEKMRRMDYLDIEELRKTKKSLRREKKKKHPNPNLLEYPPELVYSTVQNRPPPRLPDTVINKT